MVLSITKHTVPKVHFHYLVWLRNNWIHFLTSAILQGVRANVFRSYITKFHCPTERSGAFGFRPTSKRRPEWDTVTYGKRSMFAPPPLLHNISIRSFPLNLVSNIWLQWNVRYELVPDDGYISYSILLLFNAGNGRWPWCIIFRQIR